LPALADEHTHKYTHFHYHAGVDQFITELGGFNERPIHACNEAAVAVFIFVEASCELD